MVISYESSLGKFKLVEENHVDKNQNVFTVVIGKNGIGKSVMLGNIIRYYTTPSSVKNEYLGNNNQVDISDLRDFEKAIAVSTSPFDKFPLNNQNNFRAKKTGICNYLGIRDLKTTQFGNAYLSRIVSNMFSNILDQSSQDTAIFKVLKFLEFQPEIIFTLSSRKGGFSSIYRYSETISNILDRIIKTENESLPYEEHIDALNNIKVPYGFNRDYFSNKDGSISRRKVQSLQNALDKYFHNKKSLLFEVQIKKNFVAVNGAHENILNDLVFLIESGIISLDNTELFRIRTNSRISLNHASSGEQSVIVSMLGIASCINDFSLICIDEPGICLHPEWQEKYIELLTFAFEDFHGCHFIIATHSPQIISNLKTSNCFILDLHTKDLIEAKKVNQKSADYQLAEMFGVPGFRNEYLSRIALNLFTRVSRDLRFKDNDIEIYNDLVDIKSKLDDKDPVRQIISAIENLREKYA